MPRQAEAQSSRAPLQVQSSNVQAPAMALAVQAGSKPVHQPAGPAAARLPLPQQPQVKHSLRRSHQHLGVASQLPEITSASCLHVHHIDLWLWQNQRMLCNAIFLCSTLDPDSVVCTPTTMLSVNFHCQSIHSSDQHYILSCRRPPGLHSHLLPACLQHLQPCSLLPHSNSRYAVCLVYPCHIV